MELLIVLGCCFLWIFLACIAKDLYADVKSRREDRIMAAFLRAEDERFHYQQLAAIEATARSVTEEMIRAAAMSTEGTVVELQR